MIILFFFAILLFCGLIALCEAYYERDWPRDTGKFAIISLILFLLSLNVFGQNVRWDLPVYTTQAQGGNLLPVYAIPGALVSFYNEPSGTLATTYNSATSVSACPTGAQVTLNGSASCVTSADPFGNMGGWFLPGQYMATITSPFQSYNYLFTITGNPGGGIFVVTNPVGTQVIVQPSGTTLDVNSLNGVFQAYDSPSLAAALAAAYAYTTANSAPSTVNISPGNYNLATQFNEPLVGGVGVSLVGTPLATNIYMSANNGGTPWEAMIFNGANISIAGNQYTISGLNFFCTNQSKTSMNAKFGLELENLHGANIFNVQVTSCGNSVLGGADIATGGGGITTETTFQMSNILVNYDEGFYTGPAGGSGPTPPANGIDFRGSTGDSDVTNAEARNAQVCGIVVEKHGLNERDTGGMHIYNSHAYGFANLPNPVPYFQQYAFCDFSDFGGDVWLNDESDSSSVAGFYFNQGEVGGPANDINAIQVISPSYYWYSDSGSSPWDQYPGVPNLMTVGVNASGHIDVIDPVCTNHPYSIGVGSPFTNDSPFIVPALYGGIGCGLHDADGFMNSMSPINIEIDSTQNNIGSNALASNFLGFANKHTQIGFSDGSLFGSIFQSANNAYICTGTSTIGSGCILSADPTLGIGVGGSNITAANSYMGLSGIRYVKTQSTISVTTSNATIVPTGENFAVTGTGSIQTITPPADCLVSGYSCTIRIHSTNGFSLATGGNISLAMAVPYGTSVTLSYITSLAQWDIPSAFSNIGGTFTVATLPSSVPAGTTVLVSDASSFTPGACVGGGSDNMIAVWNGSNWSCH